MAVNFQNPTGIPNNFTATAPPTVNDDSGDGYLVGSHWYDVTNDKIYICIDNTSTAAVWTDLAAAGGGGDTRDYILIIDTKAANTDGGTFTYGAWRTRDLNSEESDTGGHATLSSNQITLVAGTYECFISCPAFQVDSNKSRLYNITDSAVEVLGSVEMSYPTGVVPQTRSVIQGKFTIADTKVFEVQHYCAYSRSNDGFGEGTGGRAVPLNCIYTIAQFYKVT